MNAPSSFASRRFLPLYLARFLGAYGDNVLRGAIAVPGTGKTDYPAVTPFAAGIVTGAAARETA